MSKNDVSTILILLLPLLWETVNFWLWAILEGSDFIACHCFLQKAGSWTHHVVSEQSPFLLIFHSSLELFIILVDHTFLYSDLWWKSVVHFLIIISFLLPSWQLVNNHFSPFNHFFNVQTIYPSCQPSILTSLCIVFFA